MSTYTTLQGQVTYPNQSRLDDVVKTLKNGKWMNDDECLIDEMGDVIGNGQDPDVSGLTITFPLSLYRNIGYILQEIVSGCESSNLVWTCTDGCHEAGVFDGEIETHYDLLEYAGEQTYLGKPPTNDLKSHGSWCFLVESAFHEDYA